MAYTYVMMLNPGHNRVYFEESLKLSFAELKIACSCFKSRCDNFGISDIAGTPFLFIEIVNELGKHDLSVLSKLSFVFALFQKVSVDQKEYLLPIAKSNYRYMNQSITSILKYSGKTNELFTRLMINIALFSSGFYNEKTINLLDPVSGKGTTLFEGLVLGFHVAGIEIGHKVVHETNVFFKKYLETEKYKHTFVKDRVCGENKSFTSDIYRYELARNKDEFKVPDLIRKVTLVAGNSTYANQYFKKNSFHIIVGDLPYGVAHGNVTNEKQSSLTRNPSELLKACLPGWYEVLKKNGALTLAWNKFVLTKNEIISLLQHNGFQVLTQSPYDEFEHRVDQSIKRDLIVAKKL